MRGAGFPSSAAAQSMTGPHSFLEYLFTFFCALLFTSGAALAAQVKSPATVKYAKGLLWKIEVPGARSSYLFGTIHSDDRRVTALPEPVIRALDASNRFTMEAIIDGEGLVHMAEAMYF